MPPPLSQKVKIGIVDFANRSFRDVADRDYIAARACHELGLEQQFLWMALQAVEKYVKAILLYSFRTTKPYGHRVKQAFDALSNITDIPFAFPADVGDLIEYLENQGANRYFTQSYYTLGSELLMLDKTIWYLRLYCWNVRQGTLSVGAKSVDLFTVNLAKIAGQLQRKKPNAARIDGGYLEKVLSRRDSAERRALVLRNAYYGSRNKRVLRNITFRSSSANPTHFMHPNVFCELEQLVKFEPAVQQFVHSSIAAQQGQSP